MKLRLVGRTQSAGDSDDPDHSEREIHRGWCHSLGNNSARVKRRDANHQRTANQQLQLGLQVSRPQAPSRPPREAPLKEYESRVENTPAVDMPQQRGPFADEQ